MTRRFYAALGRYGVGLHPSKPDSLCSEKDVVLITYGDTVHEEGEAPLKTLRKFCTRYLKGAISTVHVLPFFPWSSDDGFSVKDYRQVDPALGTWEDMKALASEFGVMADLVLNHCSAKGEWFREFVAGVQPASDYFVTEDPGVDTSQVVRPRTSPLLTRFATRAGDRWVWTTFSADQVDLNWRNPDLFFEFVDILFLYLSMGIRVLRLDAVAFLWKELGTDCIHRPETHEVVKLFRDILEIVAPETILLTETNVPHEENISYFGNQDEAHMVYQFSLPPLLLHGLLNGTAEHLTEWAGGLPELAEDQSFLNFTSSHDGIGVRPLTGLLPDSEIAELVDKVKARGGRVSTKTNSDGSESPYELNITYASALSEPEDEELGKRRFLCSQIVALSLQGVPAVYLPCLYGALNDQVGLEKTGRNRSINREKWDLETLKESLRPGGDYQEIFSEYLLILRRRGSYSAFHPGAAQKIYDLGKSFFVVERIAAEQTIICISNFTPEKQVFKDLSAIDGVKDFHDFAEIISGKSLRPRKRGISLAPYQTVWLVPKS
ncbi:MAG: alpha-amylase family glycosyl hydrolase [Puniceicoccales bacterium]